MRAENVPIVTRGHLSFSSAPLVCLISTRGHRLSSLVDQALCEIRRWLLLLLGHQLVEVGGSLQMATQQTLQNAMHNHCIDRLGDHLASDAAGQLHYQDGAWIEFAAMAGTHCLLRPGSLNFPPISTPGVIGRNNERGIGRGGRGPNDIL